MQHSVGGNQNNPREANYSSLDRERPLRKTHSVSKLSGSSSIVNLKVHKTPKKALSLKQTKETILEIIQSKFRHDNESDQPQMTMQQHMLAFFSQKYGLQKLSLEQTKLLLTAIEQH